MNYNLFLDDQRIPEAAFCEDESQTLKNLSKISDENWIIVRNYDEFVKNIEKNGIPKNISFDCDLHFEHTKHFLKETTQSGIYEWENFKHKCGIHCANYLKSKITKDTPIKVFTHSANFFGRKKIKEILKDWL
jgi:hypothetical protein